MLLDGDSAFQIVGNEKEQDQLKQLLNLMLENETGFKRAASLLCMHAMYPKKLSRITLRTAKENKGSSVDQGALIKI